MDNLSNLDEYRRSQQELLARYKQELDLEQLYETKAAAEYLLQVVLDAIAERETAQNATS